MVSNIRVSPSFVDPTDAEKVGVIFVVFVLFKTDANVAASVVVSLLSAYLSSNATAAAGEVVLTRNLKVVVLESRQRSLAKVIERILVRLDQPLIRAPIDPSLDVLDLGQDK